MKIGSIVYVVWEKSLTSGIVVGELEVTREPYQSSRSFWRKALVFQAKRLRDFHLQTGWQPSHGQIYTYNRKNTYLTKNEAFTALLKVRENIIKNYQLACTNAQANLTTAQNNLKYCKDHLEDLKSLNLPKLFGLDTYVSIFTGEII